MKDVQKHLHDILLADHNISADQRKALKAVIEMCDVWNKISPGFAKVAEEMRMKGAVACPSGCRTLTQNPRDKFCEKCAQVKVIATDASKYLKG